MLQIRRCEEELEKLKREVGQQSTAKPIQKPTAKRSKAANAAAPREEAQHTQKSQDFKATSKQVQGVLEQLNSDDDDTPFAIQIQTAKDLAAAKPQAKATAKANSLQKKKRKVVVSDEEDGTCRGRMTASRSKKDD